jgi:hypothetical protein
MSQSYNNQGHLETENAVFSDARIHLLKSSLGEGTPEELSRRLARRLGLEDGQAYFDPNNPNSIHIKAEHIPADFSHRLETLIQSAISNHPSAAISSKDFIQASGRDGFDTALVNASPQDHVYATKLTRAENKVFSDPRIRTLEQQLGGGNVADANNELAAILGLKRGEALFDGRGSIQVSADHLPGNVNDIIQSRLANIPMPKTAQEIQSEHKVDPNAYTPAQLEAARKALRITGVSAGEPSPAQVKAAIEKEFSAELKTISPRELIGVITSMHNAGVDLELNKSAYHSILQSNIELHRQTVLLERPLTQSEIELRTAQLTQIEKAIGHSHNPKLHHIYETVEAEKKKLTEALGGHHAISSAEAGSSPESIIAEIKKVAPSIHVTHVDEHTAASTGGAKQVDKKKTL